MIAPVRCEHGDALELDLVSVDLLQDTGRVMVDLRAFCKACRAPLKFLGVRFGISTATPTRSLDGTVLTVPAEFVS